MAFESQPLALARTPQPLSLDEIESELTTLAGHLNAGNYRFLKLLSEFERREGYAGWGIVSCAHWLSWKCGISLVAARERCRVARALDALPLVSEAMRCGRISYCKVRAITRVATPENEDTLLQVAEHGTVTHVEKTVRLFRRVVRNEQLVAANRRHEDRRLLYFIDDDGCLVVRGRLGAEQGALICKALEAAAAELRKQEDASREASPVPDRPADCVQARNADALALLAETFLARGAETLPAPERHLVTVHIDHAVLHDDTQEGRCEIDSFGALPPATVRRMCCDASLVSVVEDSEGNPLRIGRKTRTISPAMRRALTSRDGGCRYPGCTNSRFVDAHHIVHWAEGGETNLDNLTLLCRRHHRFLHEYGFSMRRSVEGNLEFTRPNGRSIPDAPRAKPVHPEGLMSANDSEQIHVDANTGVPRWDGRDPDYRWLIRSLCRLG